MLSAFTRSASQPQAALTDWGNWSGEPELPAVGPVKVTQTTAMQLLAVYGCVRLISDSISTLPVDAFRWDGTQRVEITKPRWLEQPTPDLDFEAWSGQVLTSLLLHGNSYLMVFRSSTAGIVSVTPLDPLKVTVKRERGRKQFWIEGEPSSAEIVHIPGLMLPGEDVGLSPIEYARQSIGLGLAAVRYGAEFFDGEGNMPGVIELPGAAQEGTLDNIAKQWRRKRRRGGRGLPGVLQGGAQWKPNGVTNEQAQFLATRQYTAAEIAGQMFLVDPTDLGIPVEGSSITYGNLEQRNARRVQVTLLPWIVRLERALSTLMARPRYVKFNVEGLLRGDQQSRFEAYEIGIRNRFMVPNEAREKEDWRPLPGGDEVLSPDVLPPEVN